MDIKELKKKWSREKNQYKTQETGTGVHSFIKDCFESPELFRLKEGALSTKKEIRKNEYIHEKKALEKRRADFVIYINSDIVIPVEAECFEKIKLGIKQLINYQKDFEKHYGILTDGFTWRFYNNNIYSTFTLDQIFNETDVFVEFWKEYIKPEHYYLSFFEPRGQLALLKEIEKLPVEQNQQLFFEDITALIKSFKNKLGLEGYLDEYEKKEKKAVEITYAYIIQFILYKTIADNEFDDFKKGFDESQQSIHACLKAKQYGKILGIIDGISDTISKNIYRPFTEEQKLITEKLLELIRKPKNELHEVSPWLDIFIFINKYYFGNVRYEIFGYIYENYLKELYEDEQKGQYYTDPAIVTFMLKQMGYGGEQLKDKIKNNPDRISLIDPACGSGTFLYSAVDAIINAVGKDNEEASKRIEKLVNGNIFGLDIAEFPLYLAEMSIIMRMLPLIIGQTYNNPIDKKIKVFKTKDSISEFLDTAIRNTVNDIDVEGGQQKLFSSSKLALDYSSFVRDSSDLEEMKKSLEIQAQCPRRRFDFVIGNPPYVTYNECSKQGVLITKLIQEKKAQMSNVYGMNLNTVPGHLKAYAPKPNLYAFFVALGLALLKDDGIISYIIPQTILTQSDHDVLRYYLSKFTTIEKIITFGGKMFIGRGLKQNTPVSTSSLIFVIRKSIPSKTHMVEITNYSGPTENVEIAMQNIAMNKKTSQKKILQGNLMQKLDNWSFIKHDKLTLELFRTYNKHPNVDMYRMPELSKKKFGSHFYFDKGLVFPKNKIISIDVAKDKNDYFHLIHPTKDLFKLPISNEAILGTDLRFPKGSQGIDVYNRKYKIIWRYMNPDKYYFSDQRIMISFNWVIISTDSRCEALYIQSLLNSSFNKFIFEMLLRSESEKDLLMGIKIIKNFLRIPYVEEHNQKTKDEIIKQADTLLTLGVKRLSDYVDFSRVMMQRFDSVLFKSNHLILHYDNRQISCKINDRVDLVKKVIDKEYGEDGLIQPNKIILSELKQIPIIDFGKQKEIKGYIDDLVFALYLNIPIKKLGLNRAKEIKGACKNNKFYKLIEEKA